MSRDTSLGLRGFAWTLAILASIIGFGLTVVPAMPTPGIVTGVLLGASPLLIGAGIEYRLAHATYTARRTVEQRRDVLYAALNQELDAFHAERERARGTWGSPDA